MKSILGDGKIVYLEWIRCSLLEWNDELDIAFEAKDMTNNATTKT